MNIDNKDIIVIISIIDRALNSMDFLTPNDMNLIKRIIDSTDEKNITIIRNAYPRVFRHID